MSDDESISFSTLKDTSKIMHYEALISRPGISEPDSNFIWASTFKAPIGISFLGEETFFDLFLPAGSENEGDKKLFLNRTGATFQDGIWQVRRTHEQMKNIYGSTLKSTLSTFRSLFMDYSYIEKGRVYVHLLFNENDLPLVSRMMLSVDTNSLDLRLEYLKKIGNGRTPFDVLKSSEEATSVTVEAVRKGTSNNDKTEADRVQFLMGTTLAQGVKTIAYSGNGEIPDILKPLDVDRLDENVFTFFSSNEIVVSLMDQMLRNYTIFFGYHGFATESMISLTVNLPKPLISSLLRSLGKLEDMAPDYEVRLREVVDFS